MKKLVSVILCAVSLISAAGQTPNDTVSDPVASKVKLTDDSLSVKKLDEVAVYAIRKYTKPTSRGIKVSMAGNPLGEIGSAKDAIRQMPLIDGSADGISVFGKGTPAIYINGRLMRNSGELDILTSMDLESVEIITNPSAKYGPDVKAVLLIRTKKRNEGMYATVGGQASVSDLWSESVYGSAGYKLASGITFFGDLSFDDSRFSQQRKYYDSFPKVYDDTQVSPSDDQQRLFSETSGRASNHSYSFIADGGVNYEFGKHTAGIKYTFSRTPSSNFNSYMETVSNALTEDKIGSKNKINSQSSRHYINGYSYFSLPRSVDVRIDLDYINGKSNSSNKAYEIQTGSVIGNDGTTETELYAGKIELEKKWDKFDLIAGSDYTYTSSVQNFISRGSSGIASGEEPSAVNMSATDDVRQNLYSAFISAEWTVSDKWNIYGGLRYDATRTRYIRNSEYEAGLSENYDNLLPDIGLTFKSPVTLSLYYNQVVLRPSYANIDNNYTYVTPTHWEVGNPELQSMRSDKYGLNVYYKNFILQGMAFHFNRKFGKANYYDPGINASVSTTVNFPPYTTYQFIAVQRLDIGLWHPTLQGVLVVQNLKFGDPRRKFDQPLFQISFNNRFDLPKQIYAYLSFFVRGNGNIDTQYCGGSWQTSLTLSKNYKDWYFSLVANDLFGTWEQKITIKTNGVYTGEIRKGASQYVSLSARYQFRTAKSRYRGKSVRSDEIDRL